MEGSAAGQTAPPFIGLGLVHVRDCVPPPHATVQTDQALQPPATGAVSKYEKKVYKIYDMRG